MTPVARAIVAIVLVAGAGPAGFLIYHLTFDKHPLHPQQHSGPAAPESAPAGSGPGPLEPQATGSPAEPADPTTPATQTTGLRGPAPLTMPEAVSLPDSSGRMHHFGEYRGRPLVLNFWATWCEPCRREIPLLETLYRQQAGHVQVVGVAVDFQAAVLSYAQSHGVTYPLLMGEKDGLSAVSALGMDTEFPFTVFADAQGDIVAVKRGELHADEARLILGEMNAVDAGRTRLADARSAISAGLRTLSIERAQQPSGGTGGAG